MLLVVDLAEVGVPASELATDLQPHQERVRDRSAQTVRTKGSLSPTTARLIAFKLVMSASKTWRRLKGDSQLPKVVAGVTFQDGTEVIERPSTRAA